MNVEDRDIEPQQDAAVDAEPSAEEEFDAVVAELDAEENPPADKAADTPDPSDANADAEEPETPADNAADTDAPADGNASPDGDTQEDIWANAPAQLREQFEAAQRDADLRMRSANGRVSAKDRQIADLTAKIEALQKGGAEQPGEEQQSDGSDESGKSGLSSEALAQLREDYPDLAGPLLDIIEQQNKKLEGVSKTAGTFEQQQAQAFVTQQEGVLTEQHPDWQEVAKDDRFTGWLDTQPQSVQDAMARNFNAIVDGKDAALVVGRFKQDMGIGTPASDKGGAEQKGRDPKRARQLQGGRDAGRTGPSAQTGIPEDDFDAAFNAISDDE